MEQDKRVAQGREHEELVAVPNGQTVIIIYLLKTQLKLTMVM